MKLILILLALSLCSTASLAGRQTRRVQFRGKPIFVIGVYRHPAGDANKAVLDDMAGAGFNCLLVPSSTSNEVFAEMDRLGIRAVVTTGYDMVLPVGAAERAARIEALRKMVTALKDKPALLGWEGPDEPLWNWKGHDVSGHGYTPIWKLHKKIQDEMYGLIDSLKDGYAVVKTADPEHQVLLNHAPRLEIEELRWFTSQPAKEGYKSDGRTAADAFGVDIYPVPGGGGNNGAVKGTLTPSIATVGAFTRKQRDIAGDAPIYMVLQGCGIVEWGEKDIEPFRRPTYAETRFMAFDAAANGANGILWWGASFVPQDSDLWSDIKRVARQLRSLEPILASGEVAPVKCSRRQVDLIRYSWKGHDYVVACNTTNSQLDGVSFGWEGLTGRRMNVLFEGRRAPVAGGRFRDSFAPFDVHVYSNDFSSGATTTDEVKCAFGLPLDAEPFKGKSHAEVARLLKEMGIDAVCSVPEDRGLIRQLHLAGIKVYAEMGMFAGKHWESHPESRPIKADGQPGGEPEPGYCGVCPNQDWLRKEILEKVSLKFQHYEYDGLWLDFIRYPGKWEQKKPALEDLCFCNACLEKFAKAKDVRYPAKLKTNVEKAQWILANHRQEWVEFKCQSVTDFVGQIKATIVQLSHEAILGIFSVPWTREDFDGAMLNVLGQDIQALAKHVDVFSPMVYHEMCHRPLKWVEDHTNYVWENTDRRVWPIVQVCDEPVVMTAEDVFRTLNAGLDAYGSSGVMMFAFRHALAEPAKLDALKEAFRR
ncbi:MAG: hypothetical protein Q7T82_01405 [Armatimonadota bacterium]|nr:hypothetical protein [Armatimonadota bacterium]